MAEGTKGRRGWLTILLSVAALIAVGFAAWALVVNLRVSRSEDARRVRDLAIAAGNIEGWPESAGQIGKSNLYHHGATNGGHDVVKRRKAKLWLYHPDLRDFQVEYLIPGEQEKPADKDKCDESVDISKDKMTVKGVALARDKAGENPYVERLSDASWFRPEDALTQSICFSVASLDLNRVTAVPRDFEHLLLARLSAADDATTPSDVPPASVNSAAAKADKGKDDRVAAAALPEDQTGVPALSGKVVAHIGEHRLPIRTLTELPDVEPQLLSMAQALAQAATGKAPVVKGDEKRVRHDPLQPLDSTVAGAGYRFYFYPVTLPGGESYLLVGTVRDDAQAATFERLGPRVLAFALALLLLTALTPAMKLALLGPVDGIKRIEVGALVFGLLAATAFATAALIIAADVIDMRNAAFERLKQSAAAIRTRSGDEIKRVLVDKEKSVIDELSMRMAAHGADIKTRAGDRALSGAEPAVSLIELHDDGLGQAQDFSQPDSLFPIARSGEHAKGVALAVTRDLSGTGYDLKDRPYFKRAVHGDFAPGSGALTDKIEANGFEGVWGCVDAGFVFEQVRSRPDGVNKTVVATRLRPNCFPPTSRLVKAVKLVEPDKPARPEVDLDEDRDGLQVLGLTMVLKSLIAPALHEGERFVVLDASQGAAWPPVLFHSERGRAGVERFQDALSGPAKRGLDAMAATRSTCSPDESSSGNSETKKDGKPDVSEQELLKREPLKSEVHTFGGKYEGASSLFAATRLPCTDWVIVTFISRDLVDGHAAQAGMLAAQIWFGILLLAIIAFLLMNLVKRARHGRPAWLWLWPNPEKRERYWVTILPLVFVAALTAALIFVPPWFPAAAALIDPLFPAAAALVGPLLAGAALLALLRRTDKLRKRGDPTSLPAILDQTTERRVGSVILLTVLCVAVLPIVGLARDARHYFDAKQVGEDFISFRQSREQEVRGIGAVARTYRKEARAVAAPVQEPKPLLCKGREGVSQDFGALRLINRHPCFDTEVLRKEPQGWSLTEAMRRTTLRLDGGSLFGSPGDIERPGWSASEIFFWWALALALGAVLVTALRSTLKGLFGFGVVLEAVPYPVLETEPPGARGNEVVAINMAALPSRFIAVAAPDRIRRLLRALGQPIDLYAVIQKGAKPITPPVAARPVLLFENLEMLMRSRDRRCAALSVLEHWVGKQEEGPSGTDFKIGLISDLSPLDRLLQSYERDAYEVEQLAPEDRHKRRAELYGEREDIRWSRLLESFTTFTYRASARQFVKSDPSNREAQEAVCTVEEEFAYLPDHVVEAVIGKPASRDNIAEWARQLRRPKRAIEDYLCSQLIEHYQLAWSISSHAERLLLHRYAHGQLVNIKQAYALRSLVRRGLVVLDPAPRLMNQSFAQFIRHAEEPKTLERWRDRAQKGAWQSLGTPLMIALPFALGVVAVIAIRSGESLAALIPFVVSVGPALVNFFSGNRRAAA